MILKFRILYPLIFKLINGNLRTCLNGVTSRSYKRWIHNSFCLVVKFSQKKIDRFSSEQHIK